MKNEIIAKAKECKSVEELLALAKENDIELTPEEAAAKFAELHNEGELSDEEIDNVSGGACKDKQGDPTYTDDGYLIIVTPSCHRCDDWWCVHCNKPYRACSCYVTNSCKYCYSLRKKGNVSYCTEQHL